MLRFHYGATVFLVLISCIPSCSRQSSPGENSGPVGSKSEAHLPLTKSQLTSKQRRTHSTKNQMIHASEPTVVPTAHLEKGILVIPGVFYPSEAIGWAFPFMKENASLFKGKSVMEIGTGTGAISVYAATLGATRVVATDINPKALENCNRNAERLEVADVIDTRLVPKTDISAYSVIRDDEAFDIIISNPPYSLDLDAAENDAVTDTGDLGLSIVQDLPEHLNQGGKVLLLYNSTFYHYLMVKFARHEGYVVRNHSPFGLTSWEAETLFNNYLRQLLEREGIEPDDFFFNRTKDQYLSELKQAIRGQRLFPGNSDRWHPGWMVIERKQNSRTSYTDNKQVK